MRKTISLTEEQELELLIATTKNIDKFKGFVQFDLEQGNKESAAKWEERVRTLEQVQEKLRRAKWK